MSIEGATGYIHCQKCQEKGMRGDLMEIGVMPDRSITIACAVHGPLFITKPDQIAEADLECDHCKKGIAHAH